VLARADVLAHRGPDGYGQWLGDGVTLQHWRLAIIDTSPTGRQPMVSQDGRYVLTYNGELYNFAELRTRLARDGVRFRGSSDTEVLVEAVARWGIDRTLSDATGMFAFGLWDDRDRVAYLARDRFGEKPIYYGRHGRHLVFASELKALRSLPGFHPSVDRDVLALFLHLNYVPGGHSIYEGVYKVEPGTYLRFSPDRPGSETVVRWWSAQAAAEAALARPFEGSFEDAVDRLDGLLADVVPQRMVSDVPLGAFLSGGIDSSLVVALMQARSSRPVSTYAIGFAEEHMNEAPFAAAVARHLGTDHHEWIVTGEEALAVVPQLPAMFDEPIADYSQIPTYLVSVLARRSVTVALSGDGGDELFGGYSRYTFAEHQWPRVQRIPRRLRAVVGRAMGIPTPAHWQRLRPLVAMARRGDAGVGHLADQAQRLSSVLGQRDAVGVYRALMSYWPAPSSLVLGARPGPIAAFEPTGWRSEPLPTELMMCLDTLSYLPGDILTKVDRASMATSLEVRAPLLDEAVFDFAWSLPLHMRVDGARGKRILREVLFRHVPAELVERRKTPFGAPLDEWLRGPLQPWAAELLSPDRLRAEGYLDAELVGRRWRQHIDGERNWQHHLWGVLMFQAWLEQWR
jgi:asparagine synthase (glutamine-hydrolysing)